MIRLAKKETLLRPATLLAAGVFASLLYGSHVANAASLEPARDRNTYKKLIGGEKVLADALQKASPSALSAVADSISPIVDEAISRSKQGVGGTDCDLAALSLTNIALFTLKALEFGGDMKSILIESTKDEVADFDITMGKCEEALGLPSSKRIALTGLLEKNLIYAA